MSDPRVNGSIRYAQDVPARRVARRLRALAHPHARVLSMDAGHRADAIPLLPQDVEGLGRYGCQLKDQTVLADTARFMRRHRGGSGGAHGHARAGRRPGGGGRIRGAAVLDPLSAVAEGAPLIHPEAGQRRPGTPCRSGSGLWRTPTYAPLPARAGRGGGRFACSAAVIEETFRVAGAQHAPMEPHASTARWLDDGRLELHTGTQTPFNLRAGLAGMLGIDEEQIRVVAPPMGGSFGQDLHPPRGGGGLPGPQDRPAGEGGARPRRGVGHPQPASGGGGAARRPARRHPGGQAARPAGWTPAPTRTAGRGSHQARLRRGGPYRIPHVRVDSLAVYTNLPPNGAFRGYGATQSVWASERSHGPAGPATRHESPSELRRLNLLHDGTASPRARSCTTCISTSACTERRGRRRLRARPARQEDLCVLLKGMQTPSRAAVAVEQGPVGYVIRCASCEMGQGVRESLRLMGAELLGCEPGQIEVPDPDTDEVPPMTPHHVRPARPT